MNNRQRRRAAKATAPEAAPQALELTASTPTFPIPITIEGVSVTLHPDGTATGDADELENTLTNMRGTPAEAALLVWQIMAGLRRSRPAAAAAAPAPVQARSTKPARRSA